MTDQPIANTPTRPQMNKELAALYRPEAVLNHDCAPEDGAKWDPIAPALKGKPRSLKPDYRVDPGDMTRPDCFASIQQAISQAVRDAKDKGLCKRLHIEIAPGTYNELVYVPALEVNGHKVPIPCASARGDFEIGTTNSCVMRVRNDGFEALNLTIENSYNEDRLTPDIADRTDVVRNKKGQWAHGQHQAVAVLIDAADHVLFDNVRLLGDQDTLYFKTNEPRRTVKSCFRNCHIEGDVDFIFGNSTAFFDHCEIRSKGARTPDTYVAAPSTNIHIPYGIVFWNCDFTHDDSEAARKGCFYLGRQWFERVRAAPVPAHQDRFRGQPVARARPETDQNRHSAVHQGKTQLDNCSSRPLQGISISRKAPQQQRMARRDLDQKPGHIFVP